MGFSDPNQLQRNTLDIVVVQKTRGYIIIIGAENPGTSREY